MVRLARVLTIVMLALLVAGPQTDTAVALDRSAQAGEAP